MAELNPANPAATALIYSTYLGGSNTDTASGIAVDISGTAYRRGPDMLVGLSPCQPLSSLLMVAIATPSCQKSSPRAESRLNPAGLIFPSENVRPAQVRPQTVTLTNGANVALSDQQHRHDRRRQRRFRDPDQYLRDLRACPRYMHNQRDFRADFDEAPDAHRQDHVH